MYAVLKDKYNPYTWNVLSRACILGEVTIFVTKQEQENVFFKQLIHLEYDCYPVSLLVAQVQLFLDNQLLFYILQFDVTWNMYL